MASTKANDTQKAGPSDALKSHGLSLSHSKIESYSGISDENDRNSNLSPSKSTDPARKKTFKITSVKKGGSGSGDVGGVDNDADSVDGLDESQTEDLSSEFYDSSKATDLDMDLQDCMNIPLTPDELTSTTTIVVKQKPDQNSQSRFRVVKIETKEPFRRGKWVCYDFFDTAPAALVTVEKNGSKLTEDSIIQSALSGNLSTSSSVHYVQDVNDSSSNIFIPPVMPMSSPRADGHQILSDVFVPIQPAPASQVLSQLDGLTSDAMAPFIAQQVLMSVASVPSSSSSFHNLAQPGHTTIIQSLPPPSLFPFTQNASPVGLFQNGVAGQTSQMMNMPSDAMIAIGGSLAPTALAQPVPVTREDNIIQGQAPIMMTNVPVPHSQSQTQIVGDGFVPQGVRLPTETGPSSGLPVSMTHIPQSRTETALTTSCTDIADEMGPGMDESTGSIKTLQGDPDGQTSEGLKEAVEAVGEMYMGLEGNEDDVDERVSEVAAFLSGLPQRPTLKPSQMMDRCHLNSPVYPAPFGSICCPSPLPPTLPDPYTSVFPPTTPFIPPPAPNFMGSNLGHLDPDFFPAPPPFVFSPTSPFVPFDMPGAQSVVPVTLNVTSPSIPRSVTLLPIPRSMSLTPLSPVSDSCNMSMTRDVSSFHPTGLSVPSIMPASRPRSMTFIPIQGLTSRSMSMTPVPSDSYTMSMSQDESSVLPTGLSVPSIMSASRPRSMTFIPIQGLTSRSMSMTPVPSDSYTMSMTQDESSVLPTGLSVPSIMPASRPRSMTFIPIQGLASRSMSMTPVHVFSHSDSMSMTHVSSTVTPSDISTTSILPSSRPCSKTFIPVTQPSTTRGLLVTSSSFTLDSYSLSVTNASSALPHADSSVPLISPATESCSMSVSRATADLVSCSMSLTSPISVSSSISGHKLLPLLEPLQGRVPLATPAWPQPNLTHAHTKSSQQTAPPSSPTSRMEEPSNAHGDVQCEGHPPASRSNTQRRPVSTNSPLSEAWSSDDWYVFGLFRVV